MSHGEEAHHYYLCELVKHLELVGEDRKKARSILVEPIWTKENSHLAISLCDMFVIYQDYTVPIELKGSKQKRAKAIDQLQCGRIYIEEILGHHVEYGKFVIYQRGKYLYERVDF